jgi:hypothetical protein
MWYVWSQMRALVLLSLTLASACGARTELFYGEGVGSSEVASSDASTLQPPIDPVCTAWACGEPSVFPPYVPLLPPSVPASCANGFEVADVGASQSDAYVLQATKAGGADAITLDVDFATYKEPDGVQITGVDSTGATYTLLDTCRLQTYSSAEPTGGMMRPPDETIRQFRIAVQQGTQSLTVSFAQVCSPMYLQVLGLCDFEVPAYPHGWWQAVP